MYREDEKGNWVHRTDAISNPIHGAGKTADYQRRDTEGFVVHSSCAIYFDFMHSPLVPKELQRHFYNDSKTKHQERGFHGKYVPTHVLYDLLAYLRLVVARRAPLTAPHPDDERGALSYEENRILKRPRSSSF